VRQNQAARHLFAYGTLVDPACLDQVLGHTHRGERLAARLCGYKRVSSPSFAYPYILENEGSSVDGVLIMDLSPYDMQVLDRYEEVQSGVYRREPVQVDAFGCGPNPLRVHADVYVGGPSIAT
jgi:gamma-glutamylcyclotransferase (GGCT)/AIG2-like uncharacterized protein YtfP